MKKEKISQAILLLCLVISIFFIGSFTDSWAARLLSQEELHEIQGGTGYPFASAIIEENSVVAPVLKRQQVRFDGSGSTGNAPLNYHWDFGDRTESTQINPTHRYSNPGTYTVWLRVSNHYGEDVSIVLVKVYVPHVVNVGFSGDYRIQKIKNGERVVIGPDDTDPVWNATLDGNYTTMNVAAGDQNDEVAYLKNAKPTLFKVKLWAGDPPSTAQNLTQSANIALDTVGTGWLGFNPTAVSVQNWPSSQFTLDANPGIYDRFYNYVYKYDPEDSNPFRLEWKYQVNGDTEVVPMNNTEHKIFLLLAEPQTPWDAINKPPWVEVLDDACFKVDRDDNPDAGPPHIEAWLTGIEWDPYKLKVIDDVPSSSPGSPTTYTFGIR